MASPSSSSRRRLRDAWRAVPRFARRQPTTYMAIASVASALSVFAVADFAELTQRTAWILMAVCGGVTWLAIAGAHMALYRIGRDPADHILSERAHVHALLAAVGDGVLIFDLEGRLTLVSGRFRRLFPEIEDRIKPGLHMTDIVGIIAAYGGATESGLKGREFEGAFMRSMKGGSESTLVRLRADRWVRCTPRLMVDGGLLVAVTDLTQMIQHQLKLQATEKRFELMAERLPGALFQRRENPNGSHEFVYWSSGIRDMLHREPAGLTGPGETFLSHIHETDRERIERRLRDGDRIPSPWRDEFRLRTADGSETWLSISVNYRLDPIGRMMADGVLQDISVQKLAEARADFARVEAENADRAKSDFLAHMSHELRTPLNAIIGFSEIITRQVFGPVGQERYTEYADDINRSGHHLLDLINDILDISRVQARAVELDEGEFELSGMLSDAVRLVAERADRGGQRIVTELAPTIRGLRGDRRRIMQIVTNLLSNAVKFSGEGARIDLMVRAGPQSMVIIVRDNGPGMTGEQRDAAMIPFNRANTHVAQQAEGSGLGLPLSRMLAEAHGGTLRLESAPGEGTTAILRLPAERMLVARGTPDADRAESPRRTGESRDAA